MKDCIVSVWILVFGLSETKWIKIYFVIGLSKRDCAENAWLWLSKPKVVEEVMSWSGSYTCNPRKKPWYLGVNALFLQLLMYSVAFYDTANNQTRLLYVICHFAQKPKQILEWTANLAIVFLRLLKIKKLYYHKKEADEEKVTVW